MAGVISEGEELVVPRSNTRVSLGRISTSTGEAVVSRIEVVSVIGVISGEGGSGKESGGGR